ncbi:unnamed protein product [Chrysoparadoxa australica]
MKAGIVFVGMTLAVAHGFVVPAPASALQCEQMGRVRTAIYSGEKSAKEKPEDEEGMDLDLEAMFEVAIPFLVLALPYCKPLTCLVPLALSIRFLTLLTKVVMPVDIIRHKSLDTTTLSQL